MSETPNKPGRGRPKTLDKANVTEVAMHAYWEDGPTEVSLNAICHRAGVSKPSVYRAFGNDDGLTHAALESYADEVLGKVLSITAGDDNFFSKIRQIAHLSAEDALHTHGCLFVKMRAAKAQMGPQTQELIAQIDSIALEAFKTVLTEARASGEWPGEISVQLGAQYLHSQIGLALDQRARGEDPKETLALALSVFTNPAVPSGGAD